MGFREIVMWKLFLIFTLATSCFGQGVKTPRLWVTNPTNPIPIGIIATNDAVFDGGITFGGVRLTAWPGGSTGTGSISNIVVGVGMTGGGTGATVSVGINAAYWSTVS